MSTFSAARTTTQRASSTAASTPGGQAPLCSGHNIPAARLLCKNGNNSGRWFWKCSMGSGSQCRFFKWDSPPGATPNASPAASTSTGRFTGGGQVLGSAAKPAPTASQSSNTSSSSSTQQSLPSQPPPISPNKRRRLSWQNTSPITLPPALKTPSMPPHSQSVEEAIDDDFLDDIQDFDEITSSPPQQEQRRANILNSPSSNKKSKFTSFGGAAPPTTPKREREVSTLAPGLPVTPKSIGTKPNDKWAEIVGDPESPFYARRNALNASASGAAAGNDISPASARASPLFPSGQPTTANDAVESRDGAIPSIPSAHLTSLSSSFFSFANAHNESLSALSKQIETLERQLKAANLKTAYHERNERRLQEEADQLKTNISVLKRENEELKLGRY